MSSAIYHWEASGDKNIRDFSNLEMSISVWYNDLSQRQRQFLCLVRALLRLPRVILIDKRRPSDCQKNSKDNSHQVHELYNSTR